MSILFAGIVMSHYTHHNLSPVTQILMQQTLRTVAFMCGQWVFPQNVDFNYLFFYATRSKNCFFLFFSAETCVFAFLGLSIFSFPHNFEISFVIWCIVSGLFFLHTYAVSLLKSLPEHDTIALFDRSWFFLAERWTSSLCRSCWTFSEITKSPLKWCSSCGSVVRSCPDSPWTFCSMCCCV